MLLTNFIPFPALTTDRLVLRSLEINDADDIFAHRCDDDVNTYLEDFRHATIEQTRAFISRVQNEILEGRTILWVITEKGNNRFLGTVCLWNISHEEQKAETGYTLDPRFQGKGYMNEALAKAIEFGFGTVRLKTIEAYTHEQNERSIRLLQKNRFTRSSRPLKQVSGNRVCFVLTKQAE
jgi:[ribosomal protein S5]-alanine N-acetyltransferase